MYKVIGTDGNPYGPVSADQLREWIAQNRATAQTLGQAEGANEWKPLSEFPEFAEVLAAQNAPPLLTAEIPPEVKADPEALAREVLTRDSRIEFGHCLDRSWALLKRHFWLVVGASFVAGLVESAVPLLYGIMHGGLFWMFLKLIRGERAGFGDSFAGFSLAPLQLFLAGLVSSLLTSLGFLLCILPGIYLVVAWALALPLVVDKKLDFWPAMELSRKVISRHWWPMLLLLVVNLLLVFLGLFVCCVGVYVAIPLTLGALAYAYEDIFGTAATGPA
jgi:hypothetical protein